MLTQHAKATNDLTTLKSLQDAWAGTAGHLTVDQCLAMRIDTLQSKTQYKHQYDIMVQHHSSFKYLSPNILI